MRDLTKQHAFARLDVARGIAALLVFFAHTSDVFLWRILGINHPLAMPASIVARQAVLVFFLLSGNLITRSITLNIQRNGQFDVSEYVASRMARIYPPLIGALAICVIVGLLIYSLNLPGAIAYGLPGDLFRMRDKYVCTIYDVFYALIMRGGMLQADGPLWTLFVEFQIYILVMAVAVWWRNDLFSKVWTFLLGLIVLQLLKDQLFFVLVWILGAATSLYSPGKRPTAIISGIALAGIAYLGVTRADLFGAKMDVLPGYAAQLLCCIPYAAILFVIPPNIRYPRYLIATGNFSYSLYVIHFPLLLLALSFSQNWIGRSFARTWEVMPVAVIAIVGITILFARVAEQQLWWKRILLSSGWRVSDVRFFGSRS